MIVDFARQTVARARIYGRLYGSGERPLTKLPTDLGHLWRDHKLSALGVLADLAGHSVEAAITVEIALRDAMIRAGRAWEIGLGMPEGERMYNYRPGGMHLSTEPCPGGCGPAEADDDAELR